MLGLALIALALPRTVAAWAALPSQPAIEKIGNDQRPPLDEVEAGIEALKKAIGWVPSGKRLTDLALLEVELLQRLPEDDARRADLVAAANRHLVEGLTLNPVDGYAWLRLAIVRRLKGEEGRRVAEALVQSIDVAPNNRGLWLPRMEYLFAYVRYLEGDEILALRAQIRTLWATGPEYRIPLIQAVQQLGYTSLLVWAVSEDPTATAEFERLVTGLKNR